MLRVLHAAALGLLGAGIVHLAILFMLPQHSVRNAWSRISAAAAPYRTVRLNEDVLGSASSMANPFIEAAACRFDLTDGMLYVSATGTVPFWSISIYNTKGLNVFSMSDRAASAGMLGFAVVTPEQMLQLRREPRADMENSVFVEPQVEEGLVLVRVFVPDETWKGVADAFLGSLRCEPMRLE